MADAAIDTLETTLRLLQALSLARRGLLLEAQAVVAPGGYPPGDRESLQAMAALATCEGDYGRALPLWRLLRTREPEHAEAARMIRSIELWQARPPWMKWIWPMVGIAVAVVVFVILLVCV